MFKHGVSLPTLVFVVTLISSALRRGIRYIRNMNLFLPLVSSLAQTHFAFIGLFDIR
jgi:hypothetical protein